MALLPEKFHCVSASGGSIPYLLFRSRKRRTLQIAIKDSSQVSVSAPHYLSQEKIEGFIREKSNWIFQKLAEKRSESAILQKRKYQDGEEFLFLGKKYPILVVERDTQNSSLVFDNKRWSLNIPLEIPFPERSRKVKEQLIT